MIYLIKEIINIIGIIVVAIGSGIELYKILKNSKTKCGEVVLKDYCEIYLKKH